MPKRKSSRSAQGSGTIRQRPDGRWEARFTYGYDPGSGKQLQKSIYGSTQNEVRKKLNAATKAVDEGTYQVPLKMTVSQWLDIWTEEFMGDKKFLTVKGYKTQCATHIKPGLGALKLSDLRPHDVQRFYNGLQNKSGDKKPLSPKSVRNVHGILTKALSQAVQLGYIRSNPAALVTLPRVERADIRPLTDEQVSKFLSATDLDDEYGLLMKVILLTGMRESEAIGLTWDCVSFEAGSITVCKQLQKRPLKDGGYTFAPLKNDKRRSITAAAYVMDILHSQFKKQAEQRLRAGPAWEAWTTEKEHTTALVFTTALGANLGPNTLYNHFKKIAVQIGVPAARVHDLRHTFAVLSLQNGDDIKTVQENLGHATAAFTLDTYGHASERMKSDSANRMQEYLKGIKNL